MRLPITAISHVAVKNSHKDTEDTKNNTRSTLYLRETSCFGVLVARKRLDDKLQALRLQDAICNDNGCKSHLYILAHEKYQTLPVTKINVKIFRNTDL
jgi:hypothetical protein